jgi:hypothetical protein
MIWVMIVIYMSPNGEQLMRSFHEYKTQEECLREAERAKGYPHPFGLKVTISCRQATITVVN